MNYLLISALALSACAQSPTHSWPPPMPAPSITWSFDCSFPVGNEDSVISGAALWDDYFGKRGALLRDPNCDSPTEYTVAYSPEHNRVEGGGNAVYFAVTNYGESRVTLYVDWLNSDYDMQQTIVTHEFGHVLGLSHTTGDPRCIMSPWLNSSDVEWC
jgi:hypothetical protein